MKKLRYWLIKKLAGKRTIILNAYIWQGDKIFNIEARYIKNDGLIHDCHLDYKGGRNERCEMAIEQEISVTRAVNVPKGNYCVRCGDDVENIEKCEQLRPSVSKVGWDDGLGSPGYIDFYRCALFDTGLYIQRLYGLIINKCDECLKKDNGEEYNED